MDLRKTEFIKSAADAGGFIRDGKPQVVFAGRSNVGKSSVINSLVRRKNFARVGASPGKTAQINYFLVDGSAYLIDLPGYGYAEVSKAERDRWARLMEAYFASGLVSAGVMIVDSRHKPTKDDVTMAQWFHDTGCRLLVVANKTDKAKKSELEGNLALIAETLALPEGAAPLPYSAEKKTNLDKLEAAVLELFGE